MTLSPQEKETIILFNEGDSTATIYTYNEKLKAIIANYSEQNPNKVTKHFVDGDGCLSCELPKADLNVALKKPRSERQIQAANENVVKMREKLGFSPKL